MDQVILLLTRERATRLQAEAAGHRMARPARTRRRAERLARRSAVLARRSAALAARATLLSQQRTACAEGHS